MADQFTFEQDGQQYHADAETIDLLRRAEAWDGGNSTLNAEELLFERGREMGRIAEGPAPGQRLDAQQEHLAEPDKAARAGSVPSHAHLEAEP